MELAGGADFCQCGHRGWDHSETKDGALCTIFSFPPDGGLCGCSEYRPIPRSGLAADDPEGYLLARLQLGRDLFESSGGLGRNELGREHVAYLREATDAAERTAFAVASGRGVLKKPRYLRARQAFLKAAAIEYREYDGLLVMYGHDPDDELAMDELLEFFRADDF